MRVIIHSIATFTLLVLLSACGSNSITDPVQSTTSASVNGYKFSEVTDAITIDSYKSYNIKFKLTKDGVVLPDQTVTFKDFDSKYGTLESPFTTTNSSGIGYFRYTPPVDMPASGTQVTLQFFIATTSETTSLSRDLKQNVILTFGFDANDGGDGRATTLSINYLTSTCDVNKGMIGHYNVHAVDERSNVPIVGMDVEVSLINGVKKLNGSAIQQASGSLQNTTPFTFSDSSVNFASSGITANDNLIVFPTSGAYEIPYLGGWNINNVSNSLELFGNYNNINSINNLTYIIGNEKRILGGENGSVGVLTAAHIEVTDAITDSQGYASFDVVFDPRLSGHTVVIEAHGDENGQRYGIAKKTFLRLPGDDFNAPDVEIFNTGGIRTVGVPITINPSCTGTEALIDVPISFSSFTVEPTENCAIVGGDFHTNSGGVTSVEVLTDGNITASETCTISWEGGPQSLRYEY
ncbi:MAG: Unknown protein [uncultured Sulfurovum sp.]|uniref:Cohesin domain-containing protein n=1 Tax=uncultured Sulfurovum sp. TaxID=269237 RepID=A0A6S6TMY3_9BACT|nr:MAG: Unknown protein [uncultured Sulfurovum sp.]